MSTLTFVCGRCQKHTPHSKHRNGLTGIASWRCNHCEAERKKAQEWFILGVVAGDAMLFDHVWAKRYGGREP